MKVNHRSKATAPTCVTCAKLRAANSQAVERNVRLTQKVEALEKLVASLRDPKPTGPKVIV